jgi:K+-sensing histidine kinase KdpD
VSFPHPDYAVEITQSLLNGPGISEPQRERVFDEIYSGEREDLGCGRGGSVWSR